MPVPVTVPLPERSRSLWLSRPEGARYPPLAASPATTDVVVVGAGIAGLTTAVILARGGVRVTVLEHRRVGSGATGYTSAKISALQGVRYEPLEQRHGREAAATYARAQLAGLAWMAHYVESQGVECDWDRRPAFTHTTDPTMLDTVTGEVHAAQRAGLPVRFVTESDLPFAIAGAARLDDQAQFDPYPYLQALAAEVDRTEGCAVHEGTRALGVVGGRRPEVLTERGRLAAGHVVAATGIPFLDRGLFFARAEPERSYVIGGRVEGPAPQGMYLSAGSPTRSVRSATGPGGEPVVLIGGEGHKTGEGGSTLARYQTLANWAASRFKLTSVDWRWSTQDYGPVDQLPYVGPVWPVSERLLCATGFHKWGMTNGTVAGLLLARRILGKSESEGEGEGEGEDGDEEDGWAELMSSVRNDIGRSPKAFLQVNADVGRRLVTDWAWPRRGDGRDLADGEGRVVQRGIRKVAVCRVDGTTSAVSAVCPHLGGVLQWNDAEQSWDCPLHGSRFAATGTVLQGPAVNDLAPEPATD